jgi:aspartate/methionine/tyrosine aminotransferase
MMVGFFGRGGEDPSGALPGASASSPTKAGQDAQEAPKTNFCWVNLPPNPVTRVIMSFFSRGEMLKAVQVCKSWNSVLLLDEVCPPTEVAIFS